jgi:hypothetical protein
MTPSILIATPVYGSPTSGMVAAQHHMTISSLVRDHHFTILPAVYGCDLVRGRSRLVRQFLEETSATHLLFWDGDVTCGPDQAGRLIARMVESGHDLVACTYPKKRLRLDRVESEANALPELLEPGDIDSHLRETIYEYAYSASVARPCVAGCVEVDAVPLGFALCSRSMLERMVAHYSADLVYGLTSPLVFDDVVDGTSSRTVALFQLAIRNRQLLGEDYSFCLRWREMGGAVQLWAGPDCELSHVGGHVYEGSRGGFVRA